MVAEVRPRTYDKRTSGVLPVGTPSVLININPSLLNHFIGVRWFSDATGGTEVQPTTGEVMVEVIDDVTQQWVDAQDEPIQATDPTLKASYAGNITTLRATPTDIVGATHYEFIVVSNLEGSTSDAWIVEAIETSDRGNTALGVYVQDQTSDPVDTPFLQNISFAALAAPTAQGDSVLTATPGHGIVAGNWIEVVDPLTGMFSEGRVVSVAGDDITFDMPINSVYATGDVVRINTDDLRVDGSVTPQIFSIAPTFKQKGDIVRILISIETNSSMDYTKFGSSPALTNGCVLRVKKANGDFANLFNWKTNGEFIERSLDHHFVDKTGGGAFGFVARSTYGGQSKRGVVLRLNGDFGEELQVVIQDDLSSGMNKFRLHGQGHLLQDSV